MPLRLIEFAMHSNWQSMDSKHDIQARAIVEAMEMVIVRCYRKRSSGSLTQLQWSLLRLFSRVPEQRRTVSWVASYLGSTKPPISVAVDTLAKKSLVTRVPNEDDKRSYRVVLTKAGEELVANDPLETLAKNILRHSQKECEATIKLLSRVMLEEE